VNEKLWEYVDNAELRPDANGTLSIRSAYWQLGYHVSGFKQFPEYIDYFKQLGEAMMEWAMFFKEEAK
jgi:hypothetical protein